MDNSWQEYDHIFDRVEVVGIARIDRGLLGALYK
jgi:hypothetical protein